MGHVWIFQTDIIQKQHKMGHWAQNQASAMPFQSSDLNPIENSGVNWRGEAPSWSCESKGSGVILDEGMVSDLLSGVL